MIWRRPGAAATAGPAGPAVAGDRCRRVRHAASGHVRTCPAEAGTADARTFEPRTIHTGMSDFLGIGAVVLFLSASLVLARAVRHLQSGD